MKVMRIYFITTMLVEEPQTLPGSANFREASSKLVEPKQEDGLSSTGLNPPVLNYIYIY